jgi:hypothetical protein
MTGKSRDAIVARLDGLVVAVANGCLVFDPALLGRNRFRAREERFHYFDARGQRREVPLGAGTLAFTLSRVLVVAHVVGPSWIAVVFEDGSIRGQQGLRLDPATTAEIMRESGRVRRLDLYLGLTRRRSAAKSQLL